MATPYRHSRHSQRIEFVPSSLQVPDTPWQPRHAASVFVHDGALWMVAGNNMQSDVWKLQRRPSARP